MKVSDGFQVADSRNLPKVDYLMLLEYMNDNDCYNVAETRSAKAMLASREAYVETAIGYVEVRRESNLCTTKCRVTPEHKIKGKLYLVMAVIDESSQKIVKIECNDCAASAGGCKHAICFAIWLIKRSDEPSVTSVTCYWNKPKLAGAVSDHKYILATNIGKTKRQQTHENIQMDVTLSTFSEKCKHRKITSGLILNYCGYRPPTLTDYSIYNLMLKFINKRSDHNFDNFMTFCKTIINTDVIHKICEHTQGQAESRLWHSLRQGRVTGSRIYEAVHCSTEDGALVQSILGGYKVPETKAMKRGKLLEKQVLVELQRMFNVKINNTGFILISPIIGVSPDGLCEDWVLEVKCPISEKSLKNYVKDGKIQKKFEAQILLEMHATNKNKGLFCVADPNFEQSKIIHKYWVDYNKEYVKSLLDGAEEFWKKFMFKNILDSAK